MGKDFGFTLQIDFGVDVGRVDGDLSEPSADGVNIDASTQQMRGGRVPDGSGLIGLRSSDGCEADAVRTWSRSIQWMPWRVIAWPSRLRKTGSWGERLRTRAISALTVAVQSGQRRILRPLPLSCTAPSWLGRRLRSPINRDAASETRAPEL
jgi:hypothetical protein